jgi:putative ABC transport system permease protein
MAFAIAVRALRRNAMRTALTALGMIIGVAAVIVMVAIGSGAQASIENQIQSAGSNLVVVTAGSAGFGPVRQGSGRDHHPDAGDAEAIRAEVAASGICHPASTPGQQVVAETSNWGTQVQGAGEELPAVRSWPLQFGSFFTEQDVARAPPTWRCSGR